MNESSTKFIQANSPDGGFLQSEEWRKFQKSYGRKTFNITGENFWANIIEQKLPVVGRYFYIPRGPLGEDKIGAMIKLAEAEKIGWIRVDVFSKDLRYKIVKAPHDMQPKEIFVMDVTKTEEQLLAEMKSKTRYNIKLAEKKGVFLRITNNTKLRTANNDFEEFLRLVKITAKRNEISAHPEEYYRKMWEALPSEMLKLYVAEYEGKIIAANLVLFYGQFATYLHGASDNEFRDVMAPYLLQWQAIRDAKENGRSFYDFGGVSTKYLPAGRQANLGTNIQITNKFAGITKFKLGFSPGTLPIEFSGSYDIIINSRRYYIYRTLQFIKNLLGKK